MKMGWSSVVVFVPTVLVVLNFLVVRLSVRSNDEFWLNVGNQLEAAAPSFIYDCFKAGRQAHMAAWFDKESKTGTVSHFCNTDPIPGKELNSIDNPELTVRLGL